MNEEPEPKYPGERVAARFLIDGYVQAMERFEAATRDQDPSPGYISLFESLNWAVAFDDLVREVWVPNGKPLGWGWRGFVGGEELNDLLNATRYARNLVHHHWADALSREDGARFPWRFPIVFFSWIWRPAEDLPPLRDADKQHVKRNRAAYTNRLAGVRASDTLWSLREGFEKVGQFLDPIRPAPPNGP